MKQGFNLLKPQVEAPSVWTTIYKWVVGTARIILIITESVVIIALVIRVVVDVQGKDLDENITNYENILKVRGEEEKKYTSIQTKTSAYLDSYDGCYKYPELIDELFKNIPVSFSGVDINITNKSISIKGTAPNADINEMENYLKTSSIYENSKLITLNRGDTADPNQISDFTFTTEFKELPKRQLINNK